MIRARSLALPWLCACAAAVGVHAQDTSATSALWSDVSERTIASLPGDRGVTPQAHRTLALDLDALRQRLEAAPLESAGRPLTLELPRPDGGFARFSVVESPIMEAELQAKFPELRTYRGQGIDEPAATVRFDTTPQGFHAQILAPSGRVFINPAVRGETRYYAAYYARDAGPSAAPFRCDLADDLGPMAPSAGRGVIVLAPSGATLRTYRLALAGTIEYTTAVCSPSPAGVACGLAAMVTAMNRVNGIYETELDIHMNLVANNNLLVFTGPADDGYTNNNGVTMLTENTTKLNAVIGTANYDIGHVFSTGGGGVATLNGPCGGNKARGVTGLTNPVGDNFYVDYVAHEMGHQWGSNHSFNGTTSNCGGGNRSNAHAYEPGSGTSIMGYAGICGAEDIQPHSDPYFHTDSYDQIVTFSTGAGNACAVATVTGNNPPVPNAGANFTIPANTPFELTGSATDPDVVDAAALTYDWEEFDHGAAAPPNTDDGINRTIFRIFNPTVSPSRTFPRLANQTPPLGEAYPTTNRTFNFRMIVRDNRAGFGGVNYSAMQVTSNTTAGPFLVTSPNTAVTWVIGSTPTVTWNVANTTAAPVSCANVDITLSYDGGQTFPVTLAASTPNDGTEVVTVPGPTGTTQARVKVKCANNVFLDLSDVDFTIGAVPVDLQGFSIQ
jgi:Metallo-peptidase family M12B Reprolysin-like